MVQNARGANQAHVAGSFPTSRKKVACQNYRSRRPCGRLDGYGFAYNGLASVILSSETVLTLGTCIRPLRRLSLLKAWRILKARTSLLETPSV